MVEASMILFYGLAALVGMVVGAVIAYWVIRSAVADALRSTNPESHVSEEGADRG